MPNSVALKRAAAAEAGLSVACYVEGLRSAGGDERDASWWRKSCVGSAAAGPCVCSCHAGRQPAPVEPGPRSLGRLLKL